MCHSPSTPLIRNNFPSAGVNALCIETVCVHLQQIMTLKYYHSFGLFDFSINSLTNCLKGCVEVGGKHSHCVADVVEQLPVVGPAGGCCDGTSRDPA